MHLSALIGKTGFYPATGLKKYNTQKKKKLFHML